MSLSYQIYHNQRAALFPVTVTNLTQTGLEFQIEDFELSVGEKITFVFQGPSKPDLAVFGRLALELLSQSPAGAQAAEPPRHFRATFNETISSEMHHYLRQNFLKRTIYILDTRK